MATKEQIKLEQEYQNAVKMSSSAVGALQADIQEVLNKKKNLNSETKKYLKGIQNANKGLTDSESIAKQILKNEQDIIKYKNGEIKVSNTAKNIAIQTLQQQNKSLGVYLQQQEAIDRVKEKSEQLNQKFGEGVDKLAGYTSQIPIIGTLFGGMAKKAANSLKGTFGDATKKYVGAYAKSMKSSANLTGGVGGRIKGAAIHMKSLGKGAMAAGGSMLKAFMGPQAVLLLIIGALAAGFYAIKQFEAGMKAFRDETGLVKGQMEGIEQTASSIGASTMHLTGNIEEGAKVVGQMVAGFGSIERLSNETLKNAAQLSLSYGIGADNIAQTNKLFQNLNGLSEEQAQFMTTNVAKMAELSDVSPEAVMKDINESSADMYKYFRGSPNELMKAAVQARKLGTSLKQSAEVSKSLLNFEDSINSELEASAILGRNLNFNEARYKAAKGDTLGAQQAIMKEVGKLGDLTKLNVYQQEALAKAAGMPIEDLINQQRIKEKLGKLSKEDQAAAQQLLKSGKDISNMSKDQVKAALRKQKIDNKNVEATKVMENQMKQMMLKLATAFAPLARDLMKFLQENMPQIKSFINGTATLIKGIVSGVQAGFRVISDSLQPVRDAFNEIFGGDDTVKFTDVLKTIGKVIGGSITFSINLMAKTFSSVVDIAMGLWNIIKGIFTMDFAMITDGLQQAFGGLIDWFLRIPETVIDLFASVFSDIDFFQNLKTNFHVLVDDIKSFPGKIWEGFKALGKSVWGWFQGILPGWVRKALGIETGSTPDFGELEEGGSVNDAIIQNGKIITTSPDDSIIAMKQPESLLTSMASKIGGLFGSKEGEVGEEKGFFGKMGDMLTAPLRAASSLIQEGASALSGTLSSQEETGGGFFSKIGDVLKQGLDAVVEKGPMGALASIASEGFKAITGENIVDKEGSLISKIGDVVTAPMRAVTSIASKGIQTVRGEGGEVEETIKPAITSEVFSTAITALSTAVIEGNTLLSDKIGELSTAIQTSEQSGNTEMLKKLDEVRDAVLLGALIEMDGDVLTRGIGGKLEKQLNRSNFASRLVS